MLCLLLLSCVCWQLLLHHLLLCLVLQLAAIMVLLILLRKHLTNVMPSPAASLRAC
jgi:hypothetical protein